MNILLLLLQLKSLQLLWWYWLLLALLFVKFVNELRFPNDSNRLLFLVVGQSKDGVDIGVCPGVVVFLLLLTLL